MSRGVTRSNFFLGVLGQVLGQVGGLHRQQGWEGWEGYIASRAGRAGRAGRRTSPAGLGGLEL
jgi:hypothetical protein